MTEDILPRSNDPEYAAFKLRRVDGSGDVARGRSAEEILQDLRPGMAAAAAIRFASEVPEGLDIVGVMSTRPISYDTMEILWGIPATMKDVWNEMTIVRSAFGYPMTPADGVMVMHRYNRAALDTLVPPDSDFSPETVLTSETAGITYDKILQSGRFYYYTFFFKVGTTWAVAKRHSNLIPFDYRHRDSMEMETAPFYFRHQSEANLDFLKRWYWLIGFEADYTRTLAYGVEQLYNADIAPLSLLKELGKQNFGFNFSHWRRTVGEIRYRALLAKVRRILDARGTFVGLQDMCEAASGYECFVLPGVNIMTLADDSEFHGGIGNWAPSPFVISRQARHLLGLSPLEGGLGKVTIPDEVPNTRHLVMQNYTLDPNDTPPETPCRGEMKVVADAENQMLFTCGAGQARYMLGDREIESQMDPAMRGVPVYEGTGYYFSFYMRRDLAVVDPADTVLFGFAYFTSEQMDAGYSDAFGSQPDQVDATSNPPRDFDEVDSTYATWDALYADDVTWDEVAGHFTTGGRGDLDWMSGYESFINMRLAGMEIVEELRPAPIDAQWSQYDSEFFVPVGKEIRFAVPFVWVHDSSSYGVPTSARYFTGFMVNSAQVGDDISTYRPQGHLRLKAQLEGDHVLTDGSEVPGMTVRYVGTDYGQGN